MQSGVSLGAWWDRRCTIYCPMLHTAHIRSVPEDNWATTSPGLQFFCLEKVRKA